MKKEYVFDKLEMTLDEFKILAEEGRNDVYCVAALTVVALCNYRYNQNLCYDMVNALKNPGDPITQYEKQFIRDRLQGKEYKPFSYIHGSIPENAYTPSKPFIISVHYNNSSFSDEGWGKMLMHSYGADSYREVKIRQKRSTGEWFLVEQLLLADIKAPYDTSLFKASDPWA